MVKIPEDIEICVKKLMSDPNFKPKDGKDKRASAMAVCTAVSKSKSKEELKMKIAMEAKHDPEEDEEEEKKKKKMKKESDEDYEVLERDGTFTFTESFKESDFNIEETQGTQDRIGVDFIIARSGVSTNGRRYFKEDLSAQKLKGIKIFTDHNPEATNAVGKLSESTFEGITLRAKGTIMNTARNPDVVKMVKEGLIDSVSMGGSFKERRIRKQRDGTMVEEIKGLKIKEVSFVGLPGINAAKAKPIAR